MRGFEPPLEKPNNLANYRNRPLCHIPIYILYNISSKKEKENTKEKRKRKKRSKKRKRKEKKKKKRKKVLLGLLCIGSRKKKVLFGDY